MAPPRRAGMFLAAALLFLTPRAAHALAMQISNISDFSFPSWSIGDPGPQGYIDICIYGLNIPTLTSYAITISSSPSSFQVGDGSGHYIAYSLYWDDSGAGSLGPLGTQLSDGVKLYPQHNNDILSTSCALGGPNARLTLKITQAAMTAARSGSYTGTITLLLTPN